MSPPRPRWRLVHCPSHSPEWRNWQTRWIQNPGPRKLARSQTLHCQALALTSVFVRRTLGQVLGAAAIRVLTTPLGSGSCASS